MKKFKYHTIWQQLIQILARNCGASEFSTSFLLYLFRFGFLFEIVLLSPSVRAIYLFFFVMSPSLSSTHAHTIFLFVFNFISWQIIQNNKNDSIKTRDSDSVYISRSSADFELGFACSFSFTSRKKNATEELKRKTK